MTRRGEHKQRQPAQASVPPAPRRQARVGVRSLTVVRHGESVRARIDPSLYQCSALAAELADEWVEYCTNASLREPGQMAQAVRWFAEFVDEYCAQAGADARAVRLGNDTVDLVDVVYDWERVLVARCSTGSKQPVNLVNTLLNLIHQRSVRDGDLPDALARRALGHSTLAWTAPKALDEFSNAERLRLRAAARSDVTALETRLARGRALLDAGADPRREGWSEPANLVWAARHGLLTTGALNANLPRRVRDWPAAVRGLVPDLDRRIGVFDLMLAVAGLLYPREKDLMPFRVLLLLQMVDTTPEELHDLGVQDIEFTDGGVRLVQIKNRADRVRTDVHTDQPAAQDASDAFFQGSGSWDVPGLLRRLLKTTSVAREAFAPQPWLLTAVESRDRKKSIGADRALFTRKGRSFSHWIITHRQPSGQGAAGLDISQPHDIRRLRKTAKTTKVVALGGTVSDLAGDDHHVQVFERHYAHGTTAHVLAARAINRAQHGIMRRLADRPVFVPPALEQRLEEPEIADAVGISTGQAKAVRSGDLDMGLVDCRDPYDSPHTPDRKLCHVAPAMCMLCPNALIFTSHLPRLVMLADHIERVKESLDPPRWHAVWGRQEKALAELFDDEDCKELIPAARQQAADLRLRLDLPLGMRTEYDR